MSELASVSLDIARRWYAEVLRCTAQVLHNEAVVQAFAKVPRERFLDPGPWRVIPPGRAAYTTTDADPRWLYHNVLVVIDEGRDLNNGEPRLWAYLFDYLYVRPGERVLQVGAGTYYYIAILREMTGQTGSVIALEYDDELAFQAEANLVDWPQVQVVCCDGNGLRQVLRRTRGKLPPVRSLHRGEPPKNRAVWFHRPGFWLSRRPLSSRLKAGSVANW